MGRVLCCVLTARRELQKEQEGGWVVEDGQSFPINERGLLCFKKRQEHLGDLGKVN